jgi:hypothetical protein
VVAGDGLRSVGEEYLPLTKSVCSILPTARHLRAGAPGTPGPRFLKATAVLALSERGRAKLSTKKGRVMEKTRPPDVVRAGPPDLREGG